MIIFLTGAYWSFDVCWIDTSEKISNSHHNIRMPHNQIFLISFFYSSKFIALLSSILLFLSHLSSILLSSPLLFSILLYSPLLNSSLLSSILFFLSHLSSPLLYSPLLSLLYRCGPCTYCASIYYGEGMSGPRSGSSCDLSRKC